MDCKEFFEKVSALNELVGYLMNKSDALPDGIELCAINVNGKKAEIHVYKGIEILADFIGANLRTKRRNDEDFPILYFFDYNGADFIQLDTDPPEKMA